MIDEATARLRDKENLNSSLMQAVMEEIMTGRADTPQIIPFLVALGDKGESIEELTAAVTVMRRYSTKIDSKGGVVLDTCGTGGDKKGTFNISTIVAFVASGCGIKVAKHGNRSVSSKSGSADVLEALGVNIQLDSQKASRCLNEIGIAFLFAQNFHPAMKYAMPARKQIARQTIFNILGPLSNPAAATHQLVGVYDEHLTKLLVQVLVNLGVVHALVVHAEDGLDEITTTASTSISEARNGKIINYKINPRDFGIKEAKLKDISGGTASRNAEILLDILNGISGPGRDIVLLNAAAAIYAADQVNSLQEGITLAVDSIDSGRAMEKLRLLKEYSNKV
ncbi:anthranilate phosphoribosyltransferase [bacterium]|nr:MAG: anthranilate phosphoribosyltransferase [bacterium]